MAESLAPVGQVVRPLRRCQRFVRRHSLLTAVALALVAVLLMVTWGAVRREQAAARDLYRLQVREASTALRLGDTAAARAALAGTAEALPGWEWRHLEGRADPAVARTAMGDWPQHLSWAAGGDVLLGLARRECATWRWDDASLSPLRHLVGRSPEEDRFTVSSDLRRLLAFACEPGNDAFARVELVDLETEERRTLGHAPTDLLGGERLGFSPDGRRIDLPGPAGTLHSFRVQRGWRSPTPGPASVRRESMPGATEPGSLRSRETPRRGGQQSPPTPGPAR